MTFHCFFDRHTPHTHTHGFWACVLRVWLCVFLWCEVVRNKRSLLFSSVSRPFFSAGRPQNNKINPLHRLCNNSQAGSTISFARIRLFFLFVGFFWPIRTVTHHRWTHFSFKCFSPSLQSIFHRSNNLLLRYRSHSRYLSHFQRIHLAWGKRFKLHSQTILLLRNKIKTFFFFLEREEKKKKPKECVVCGVV